MEWTDIELRAQIGQADRSFQVLLDIAADTLRDFHLRIGLRHLARSAALAGTIPCLFRRFGRSKERDILALWPPRRAGRLAIHTGRTHRHEKRAVGTAILLHHCLPVLLFNGFFHILHGAFLLIFLNPSVYMIRYSGERFYPFLALTMDALETVQIEPCLIYWRHDSRRTPHRTRRATQAGPGTSPLAPGAVGGCAPTD